MKPKSAISLGIAVVIVIALIIVAGFGTFLYATLGQRTASSTTNTPSGTLTATTYNTISNTGLDLQIKINQTTFASGQPIGLQVVLANTLNESLTLQTNWSANPNIANWELNDSLCGISSVEHTFGYAIFKGHYTMSNISKANDQLIFDPPNDGSCPNGFYNTPYIQDIQFAPNCHCATLLANSSFSNVFKGETINMLVNATTYYCDLDYGNFTNGISYFRETNTTTYSSGAEFEYSCGETPFEGINGYWTIPTDFSQYMQVQPPYSNVSTVGTFKNIYQNYFHLLPVGPYTVVAEDIWNQTVLGYFEVVPQSVSSSLACNSTNYDYFTSANTTITNSSTFITQTSYISSNLTTFTTTVNVSRSSGYVTTTTEYYPPNSWAVSTCTYSP